MAQMALWPVRVAAGHPRIIGAAAIGFASWLALPRTLGGTTRSVLAWDVGALAFLVLAALMFSRQGDDGRMSDNAIRQQEGEWSVFWVVLLGVVFSFVALGGELAGVKDLPPAVRTLHIALVAATLLLSWLATHTLFAMRYAHEYYTTSPGNETVDGGLDFPGDDTPDYWDFTYFALVLGMTFQVSDVQITSRKFRRLATVHGLVGFLFNTVIVALMVNIAASLLS